MIELHSQHKWTKTLASYPYQLINVNPKDIDQFLKAWAKNAAIMKEQPGFVSTQLYRGIAGSCTFINYAVRESSDHYKQVFGHPSNSSLSTLSDFPTNTVSPHLFKLQC
jgi:hypothetical protein